MNFDVSGCASQKHGKVSIEWKKHPYPYNGLMLQGKNATEKTNCEAEGDNLSLSFSW